MAGVWSGFDLAWLEADIVRRRAQGREKASLARVQASAMWDDWIATRDAVVAARAGGVS